MSVVLMARALLGIVFLLLLLGAACFIPAGTFHYWQAGVFLGIFAACALAITLYLERFDRALLARRVQAGPIAETRPLQQALQGFASVLFISLFILSAWGWRSSVWLLPPWASVVGDALVACGFLIVFLVFRENTFTSATIEVASGQTLVSSGPYRFVRHPMYAGAVLLLLGVPAALGSGLGWLAVLPLIGVIVARLLDEEQYLQRRLSGYPQYCRRVPYRLVPLMW